jgi:hypothetical protein
MSSPQNRGSDELTIFSNLWENARMIVLQSSATVLRPCPSGIFENSQQHARVIYGWVHRPHQPKVPQRRQKLPQIFNPAQGYANLSKAMQAPPPGRAGKGLRSRARCGYLHLFAHSSEKKRLFIFWLAAMPRRESTQINPSTTKYRPHTDSYRPKNEITS